MAAVCREDVQTQTELMSILQCEKCLKIFKSVNGCKNHMKKCNKTVAKTKCDTKEPQKENDVEIKDEELDDEEIDTSELYPDHPYFDVIPNSIKEIIRDIGIQVITEYDEELKRIPEEHYIKTCTLIVKEFYDIYKYQIMIQEKRRIIKELIEKKY